MNTIKSEPYSLRIFFSEDKFKILLTYCKILHLSVNLNWCVRARPPVFEGDVFNFQSVHYFYLTRIREYVGVKKYSILLKFHVQFFGFKFYPLKDFKLA